MDALRLRAERLEGIAELSASLAHEIKNPLASIRSAVEQIARMPAVSDDQKTLSALVMRESDRLSRLLSEFLDFARVRVAKTKPIDLADVARGAARLAAAHPDRDRRAFASRARSRRPAAFTRRRRGPAPPRRLQPRAQRRAGVAGQQRGAHRSGARAARPDSRGNSLRLRAPSRCASATRGRGFRAEIRDRMFDPFFTTKSNGSGLGLAVVHRAIEAHRGLVFVDSGCARARASPSILPSTQNGRGSHDTPLTSRSAS